MFSKCLAAIFAVAPTMLAAQEHGKIKLQAHEFSEVVKDAAEISGARLVGFARFDLSAETEVVEVSAHIPMSWSGAEACLSVMSVDGFYQSKGTYRISNGWSGGIVALEYPTERPERVLKMGKDRIAPLLTRGACGGARLESTLVQWGNDPDSDLMVLLNTSRSEETFLFFPDKAELEEIECRQADFDNRTAFDTVCLIPPALTSILPLRASTVSFKRGEMGREEQFLINAVANE